MIEKPASFGEAQNLVGIVTLPEVDAGTESDLAFVLLNAGVIHRIGPGRLNVKLARSLAAIGYTSLRFDLSGIGDSRASQSTLSFEAQAVADIQAAMDFLHASRAISRFALVGLCSGADNGFATAVVDPRVIGLVLLDPNPYPTWKTAPRFQLIRLRHPRSIVASIGRRIRLMLGGPGRMGKQNGDQGGGQPPSIEPSGPDRYVRPKPTLAEFAAGLTSVLDRGGAVMAVYTGSSLRQFSYPGQLDDALRPFGIAGRIDCRLWADVNHTFTELAAQTLLVDTIAGWARALAVRSGGARP